MSSPALFGLLNVNKPQGITSRDAVNRIQRLVRGVKVGHAGTLDPLATGVLVIGLGPATRLVEYVQCQAKRYEATFLLGRTSDTEDIEGQVVELEHPPRPTRDELEAVLPRFVGVIDQLPPAFSALKVAGQRAYALARQGKPVELQPRSITVHELLLRSYEYPVLRLSVLCGSGTYIRSLGRDVAQALGTGAVMSALERTAIGDFCVAEAWGLEDVTPESIAAHLLPARRAVPQLSTVELTPTETHRLAHGMAIQNRWQTAGPEIAGLDEAGNLVAILTPHGEDALRPLRNFTGN